MALTDTRTVLITGATGDTGRAAVRESVALGLHVRAMVHKKDARSEALETLGAEVVIGDLLEIEKMDVPPYIVQHLRGAMADYQNGHMSGADDNVERPTGRRSMTVGEFARAHADVLNPSSN